MPASPITINVPGGAASGTYNGTLTVTNSSTTCTSIGYAISVIINTLPAPSVAGNSTVCETETDTYSTAPTGNNFTWTVTGGSIDSGQGTNQISVTWDVLTPAGTLSATGTVEVQETIAVTSCQVTDVLNVTIYRVPQTGPAHHIGNDFNE